MPASRESSHTELRFETIRVVAVNEAKKMENPFSWSPKNCGLPSLDSGCEIMGLGFFFGLAELIADTTRVHGLRMFSSVHFGMAIVRSGPHPRKRKYLPFRCLSCEL